MRGTPLAWWGTALMPLMNTPFGPGECLDTIAAMPEGPQRDIATAEYHYFSGQAEKAARRRNFT